MDYLHDDPSEFLFCAIPRFSKLANSGSACALSRYLFRFDEHSRISKNSLLNAVHSSARAVAKGRGLGLQTTDCLSLLPNYVVTLHVELEITDGAMFREIRPVLPEVSELKSIVIDADD
jgi:hypothetical protein